MNIFNLGGTDPAHQEPGSESGPAIPICSRKGCGAQAEWQLLWNNPRIHSPARRKIWLGCPEHRDWLEDYLQTRGLWKETLPLNSETLSGGVR